MPFYKGRIITTVLIHGRVHEDPPVVLVPQMRKALNCNQGAIVMMKQSACVYLFKINNGNCRTMSGICSKLTMNTLKQHHGAF